MDEYVQKENYERNNKTACQSTEARYSIEARSETHTLTAWRGRTYDSTADRVRGNRCLLYTSDAADE